MRFDQCTETCTTDCGHCKGRPVEELRAHAARLTAERDEALRVIRNAHAAIRRNTTAAAVALAMFDTSDRHGPSLLDELRTVTAERDALAARLAVAP